MSLLRPTEPSVVVEGERRSPRMAKRMLVMLLGMAAFVSAVGFVKYRQVRLAIAQASSFQPPPEAVTTLVAREVEWSDSLNAIGTVTAVRGVTVSADLP